MNRKHFLLTLTLVFLLACCSNQGNATTPTANESQTGDAATQTDSPLLHSGSHDLMVFAAASLTGAFQEIGRDFEATHPGVKVSFNFAGSQILRTQLEQGAAADVYASADHKNMDALISDNLIAVDSAQSFATNQLVVIVPTHNPGNLQKISDLSNSGIKLVLADASVPAGNYARQMLMNMSADPEYGAGFSKKVLANVVSNETDVKQVVAKVELGEADAGIVYITDAIAAPDLKAISIPEKYNIVAKYPIAILMAAHESELGEAFIEYVLSTTGQEVLAKWGFGKNGQ